MAGMFYSQQEAAEKLGVTEEEVKQLARDGKLREFRDGPNVMFKIDEVEGLAAGSGLGLDDFSGASEPAEGSDELDPILEMNTIDDLPGADEELSLPPGDTASDEAIDDIIFDDDLDLTPVPDATSEESPPPLASEEETVSVTPAEDAADEDLDGLDELLDLADEAEEEAVAEPQALEDDDDGLEPIDDQQLEEELLLNDDVAVPAAKESTIDLADDTQVVSSDAVDSLTAAEGMDDTALTPQGISVLGESDAEFKLTDDTLAETLAGLGGTGDTSSLEDIEDDVNLDSFGGSGSGLLDLSLQADDTSLGGILDEIYTSDEGGGSPSQEDSVGSTEHVVSDGLDAMSDDEGGGIDSYAPTLGRPLAAELAADSSSNLLGGLLLLPLFVLMYTAIVTISAFNDTVPGILSSIQGIIWYILAGLAVVGLIVGVMGLTGGGTGTKKPKAKKGKKTAKAKKPKKEKKPKPAKK